MAFDPYTFIENHRKESEVRKVINGEFLDYIADKIKDYRDEVTEIGQSFCSISELSQMCNELMHDHIAKMNRFNIEHEKAQAIACVKIRKEHSLRPTSRVDIEQLVLREGCRPEISDGVENPFYEICRRPTTMKIKFYKHETAYKYLESLVKNITSVGFTVNPRIEEKKINLGLLT